MPLFLRHRSVVARVVWNLVESELVVEHAANERDPFVGRELKLDVSRLVLRVANPDHVVPSLRHVNAIAVALTETTLHHTSLVGRTRTVLSNHDRAHESRVIT